MSEALTERIITPMGPALVASIDDYRFANRVPSRAEAMRTLLQRGLAANGSVAGPRPLSELVLEYYTADPDRVEEFEHPDIATAEQAAAFELNAPKRKSHRDYEALYAFVEHARHLLKNRFCTDEPETKAIADLLRPLTL
jgi:hypothetical protein